jgi:formamidopyrimidine-DNA glycosylase
VPELPDVEVFKQYLDATSFHKEIDRVEVHSPQVLEGISASKLRRRLEGHTFESTRRHGKYLFVRLNDGNWLVLHFGMTGSLKYFRDLDKDTPHDRFLIGFSNGYHLAYDSQRKLGKIGMVEEVKEFVKEKVLGPDALDPNFDITAFGEALTGRTATVKAALMNQKHIAGIGNIYSDEILFQAGIRPQAQVDRLKGKALERLFQATKEVLQTAIDCRADPGEFPNSYLIPVRHKGRGCPKCERAIREVKISGRTAYYCSHCQKKS